MGDDVPKRSAYPRIDLDTVRETLSYMRDDMATTPDLARVSQALSRAIDEIAALGHRAPDPAQRQPGDAKVVPFGRMQFVPWLARN